MNGVATVSRLPTILAVAVTLFCAAGIAAANDSGRHAAIGVRSIATVSNGVVTHMIASGPDGLELSSNGPGTITVTSGSNSVTVRGPSVTLSGGVVLAPFPTPGVRVTANKDGGYTAVLDTPLSNLPDADTGDKMEAGRQLAKELADADFGDRRDASGEARVCKACPRVTADRCVAPPANSASP